MLVAFSASAGQNDMQVGASIQPPTPDDFQSIAVLVNDCYGDEI
jgi:hypothetical protein